MTKSRNILKPRTQWTSEMLATLTSRYPNELTKIIADALNLSIEDVYRKANRLGLKKTATFLETSGGRIGKNTVKGASGRFSAGHQPWNKGTKGLVTGGKETQFKKGQKPPMWLPIGSERLADGYLQVKVTDTGYPPRDWRPKHRLIYEAVYGAIPAGHVLIFKNGNKQDIRLENLELLSRQENALRNSVHRYPKEIVNAIRTRGLITRQINKLTKEKT